jgi:hypothetical protein
MIHRIESNKLRVGILIEIEQVKAFKDTVELRISNPENRNTFTRCHRQAPVIWSDRTSSAWHPSGWSRSCVSGGAIASMIAIRIYGRKIIRV